MNCNNTISDGFRFWIGKSLAEVALGLTFIIVLTAIVATAFVISERRRKP